VIQFLREPWFFLSMLELYGPIVWHIKSATCNCLRSYCSVTFSDKISFDLCSVGLGLFAYKTAKTHVNYVTMNTVRLTPVV